MDKSGQFFGLTRNEHALEREFKNKGNEHPLLVDNKGNGTPLNQNTSRKGDYGPISCQRHRKV